MNGPAIAGDSPDGPGGRADVLSGRSASLVILACLFCGLFSGGLRDQVLAAPVLACVGLAVLLGPRLERAALAPWLPFLGWAVLSLLASPQPLTGLALLARWTGGAVFFSAAASLWTEARRRLWFWALAGCGLVLAAASFLVDVPGYPKVGILPLYYNYTCFVQAALFCAVLPAVLRPDGPRGLRRAGLAALAACALAQILWAHSRGACVAVAAGAGVFAWRHAPRRRFTAWTLALALGLGATLLLATWAKISVASGFKRPQIWKAAILCAADRPVFGVGPGQFANAFLRHNFPAGYDVGNFRFQTEHAHSEVMELAVELGVPGILLLLTALGMCLRPGRVQDSTWTREAGLAAFAGMSAQCLIDNLLHLPALELLYVSALAAAWTPRPDGEPAARSAGRGLALAVIILAAVSWVPDRLLKGWQEAAARDADPARRLESILRCVRLAPADPYLRENLAGAWLAQNPPQPDEAMRQLALAQELSPTNAVYPAMRAQMLERQEAWPQALAAADRAVALEPDYFQARLLRAEALLRLERRPEAQAELAEVCRRGQVLGARLNTGVGYMRYLLGFDRARYEGLSRRTGMVCRPRL